MTDRPDRPIGDPPYPGMGHEQRIRNRNHYIKLAIVYLESLQDRTQEIADEAAPGSEYQEAMMARAIDLELSQLWILDLAGLPERARWMKVGEGLT